MTFLGKPSGGPDPVGGLFPRSEVQPFRNRSGATNGRGALFMLDLAAATTEIATNDSNSYLPGAGDASDDSVWNTMIDPTAAGLDTGGIFGITLERITDNGIGKFQLFGIVEEADCVFSGSALVPGTPLTGRTDNRLDGTLLSNERVIAHFIAPAVAATNATVVGRVFLHQGVISAGTQNP